jgi:hypothetical protein
VNVLFHLPVIDWASQLVQPTKLATMNARRSRIFNGEALNAEYLLSFFKVFLEFKR